MRKSGAFILTLLVGCGFACGNISAPQKAQAAENQAKVVYIGGMTAGFTLSAGGAQVIGLCEVATKEGAACPAVDAGVRAGDLIKKAAGIDVKNVSELNEILEKSKDLDEAIEKVRALLKK